MYTSKIILVVKESHDTVSLRFERPEGFDYVPGKYCIFEAEIDGKPVKRAYSLSSSPTEDFLQITVKNMPNGCMSKYMNSLHAGDTLTFSQAVGKFLLEDHYDRVVFIAGGSGISPFRSMIKDLLDVKETTDITMIYGCRSPRDIILNHELHEYIDHENFHLFITVDHPDESWHYHTGFIDADFIREATNNDLEGRICFICGPPIMVEHVQEELTKLGVPEENIKLDEWG